MTHTRIWMMAAVLWMVQPLFSIPETSSSANAAPDIFASPVHAGCYLARHDRCKIHVEPFTIDVASGQKLVKFQLVAIQGGTGRQTVIYDFRPDQSNPVPETGTLFTPTLVARDFAATCGNAYEISLQGQDTGDTGLFSLGLTGQFSCPVGTYNKFFQIIMK
jgi:hypothetical protein